MELWTGILSWWKCHWPSSDGISSWTPLKPRHSNPNPNPLANQLWCIDILTPRTPIIILHRLPAFLESLMPLKNWCSIHARGSKSSLKHSIHFCDIFPSLKHNFIAYRFSLCSEGCPRGVMVKAMDCTIVVCVFILQSRYYVHFRGNTLGKSMNPLILPAMG